MDHLTQSFEERANFFKNNKLPKSPWSAAKSFYDKFQFKSRSSGTDSLRKTVARILAEGDDRVKHLSDAFKDPELRKREDLYFKERKEWSYDVERAAKKASSVASVLGFKASIQVLDSSLSRTISTVEAANLAATAGQRTTITGNGTSDVIGETGTSLERDSPVTRGSCIQLEQPISSYTAARTPPLDRRSGSPSPTLSPPPHLLFDGNSSDDEQGQDKVLDEGIALRHAFREDHLDDTSRAPDTDHTDHTDLAHSKY